MSSPGLAAATGVVPPRRTWSLRRRRYLAAGAAAAVVAALVVTDLPARSTASYRQATLASYVAGLQSDVASCNAGVHDALQAAVASLDHSADIAPGVAATFTNQAVAACSFTDSSEVDLAQMQPPHGVISGTVDELAPTLSDWVFPAAFRALNELADVLAHPQLQAPRRALARDLAAMQSTRARVEALTTSAERALGAPRRPIGLVSTSALIAGDRLPAATSAR